MNGPQGTSSNGLRTEVQQKIRTEQIKINVVVRKKQIEIKEEELIGTVRLPAEAEAFK